MSGAVVLGGGADALVAAALLARSGRRVTLLNEGRAGRSSDEGWVPAHIPQELALQVAIQRPDPWARALLPDGGTLELWQDIGRTVETIGRLSAHDASRWPDFCRRMATLAQVLQELYLQPAADPLNVRLALRVRKLGRQGMEDLMRLLPMSVAELLDDWFECDALKGALAAMGILHLQQGPRSGGTAFRFLHHHVGCPPGVFRPARSNLTAALRASAAPAVDQRGAAPARITVRGGRVTGVVLVSGEEIAADLVVSGIDPRRTLLELTDPGWLDPQLARALTHVRRRGVAARVSFSRRGPPSAHLTVAPSLDYLERAYDEVKYGRVSTQPYLEAQPAAEGLEVHFQYAPYRGSAEIAELARRALVGHYPEIGDASASVLTPADLEAREGWPEGQPYHAELALDQALWMRPLPQLAQYRTPIEGLWLCGPGTHPGGPIAGASGYLCAREILKLKTA